MEFRRGGDMPVDCTVGLSETAMQVAVRMPSKGTYVTLWMHEHFAVYKNKSKPKGKRELDIYQRLFLPAFESLLACL
jgi:hypothetical protein